MPRLLSGGGSSSSSSTASNSSSDSAGPSSSSTSSATAKAAAFFTLPFRRKKQRYTINPPDDQYDVVYLGNVLTVLARGDGAHEKPLSLIWKAYCQRARNDLHMQLKVTRSGLKAETRQQGLTEYFAHRITHCAAPAEYPRIFCWVYKHEGRRMRPELRCHAVLCRKASEPPLMQRRLQNFLVAALQEYRREKMLAQHARSSLSLGDDSSPSSISSSQSSGGGGVGVGGGGGNSPGSVASVARRTPRRRELLQTGSLNFRPPASCRSKSTPRLGSIDEEADAEREEEAAMILMAKTRLDEDEEEEKQQRSSLASLSFEEEEEEEAEDEDEEEPELSDVDSVPSARFRTVTAGKCLGTLRRAQSQGGKGVKPMKAKPTKSSQSAEGCSTASCGSGTGSTDSSASSGYASSSQPPAQPPSSVSATIPTTEAPERRALWAATTAAERTALWTAAIHEKEAPHVVEDEDEDEEDVVTAL